VQDALNSIINSNNLTYEQPEGSNIFVVRNLDISPIRRITKVYHLKHARCKTSWLNEAIETAFSVDSSGDGGDGGGDDSSEGDDDGGGESTDGRDVVKMLENILSEHGVAVEDARTNSIIVTDVPAAFPLIEQTIAAIDVAVPQVVLEVEMLDVSKALLDKIGLKWPQTFVQYGGSSDNTSLQMQTPWPYRSGLSEYPSKFAAGISPYTQMSQVAEFTVFGGGITLDMIRTDTRTKFLARPRLLTLSGEAATIAITKDQAIGASSTTSGSSDATTTGSSERAQTGVSLIVTPQVDEESGQITLFVKPTVTKTGSTVTFAVAGSDQNATSGTFFLVSLHQPF